MRQLSPVPRHPPFKVHVVRIEPAEFPVKDPPAGTIPPLGQSKRLFSEPKKVVYITHVGASFHPMKLIVYMV